MQGAWRWFTVISVLSSSVQRSEQLRPNFHNKFSFLLLLLGQRAGCLILCNDDAGGGTPSLSGQNDSCSNQLCCGGALNPRGLLDGLRVN
jgi:hypothetical protein